jgi:ferredoxin
MDLMSTRVLITAGVLVLIGFGFFTYQSLQEHEPRAGFLAAIFSLSGVLLILAGLLLNASARMSLLVILAVMFILLVALFLLPIGKIDRGDDHPKTRIDERDIMFARARMEKNTPRYNDYYQRRPEKQSADDSIRNLPGLLSPDSKYYHPLHFAAAEACFLIPEALRDWVDGEINENRTSISKESFSGYLKALAIYLGAKSAGITELKDYHLYSHIGRGSGEYGQPITLNHTYALAFSVEMDYDMVGTAPDAPEVIETAQQYARSGQIAVQLAAFIRELGYPARAHIDGNYRVVAPLVARDAGLGEIGRMGVLMTPRLGPRVRLAVVTTDIPLVADQGSRDNSVLDFCRICKKCAENCPSRAIPMDDRQMNNGALRWQISDVRCFHYWNVVGTDCGRCMTVCPYSHPDNASHNLVRWAIKQSGFGRRSALWLDDLFYGRKPGMRRAPEWTKVEPPKDLISSSDRGMTASIDGSNQPSPKEEQKN